jgi:hypothetical protein
MRVSKIECSIFNNLSFSPPRHFMIAPVIGINTIVGIWRADPYISIFYLLFVSIVRYSDAILITAWNFTAKVICRPDFDIQRTVHRDIFL